MIRHLCSLKEFGPYLCMVSRSRFFGRLMIMMASNGHFCRDIMLSSRFTIEDLRPSLLDVTMLVASAARARAELPVLGTVREIGHILPL